MEEEIVNVVSEMECKFVKTDMALIEGIASKQKLSMDLIRRCLRYNIFTVKQFATLAGITVGAVTNLTRPTFSDSKIIPPKINYCYPFPDNEGTGPKYIVRDERSEKYFKI